MGNDIGFEVVKVEDLCTLGLRQYEVEKEDQSDPSVEGDPAYDEDGP
jgi:hypothetical protein